MVVAAFPDLGKAARDLLYGGRGGGAFGLDTKVTTTSRTADGVGLTATFNNRAGGGLPDATLKAAYAYKKYTADALLSSGSDQVNLSGSILDVAPGVKAGASLTLPDPASGKLSLDYTNPYLALKTSVGLTSAPVVEAALTTGYKNLVLGGEAAFDTTASSVTKWSLGLGIHRPDSQFVALIADKGDTARLLLAHNVTSTKSLGVEVVKRLNAGTTRMAIVYARTLDNGALTKLKLESNGALSALYEQRLPTGEKVALAGQVDALSLSSKPPKVGVALDLA